MKKTSRLSFFTLVSILILIGSGCTSNKIKERQPPPEVAVVTTGKARTERFEGTGTLNATGEINVFFLVGGMLEAGETDLKPGMRFKKGQLLYTINNKSAYTLLRKQQNQLMQSVQGALPEIKRLVPKETLKWETFLHSISPTQFLPVFPHVNSHEETSLILATTIHADYKTAALYESAMKHYFYIAPFDGVVVKVSVQPGKTVKEYTAVATIARSSAYELIITPDLKNITSPTASSSLEVFDSKGSHIGTANVNPRSRALRMKATFKADKGVSVQSGQPVKVLETEQHVISFHALPEKAVQNGTVLVVGTGKAVKKEVYVSTAFQDSVYVQGLSPGMRILQSYDEKLAGKPVRVK